jgi:hypothetical protein
MMDMNVTAVVPYYLPEKNQYHIAFNHFMDAKLEKQWFCCVGACRSLHVERYAAVLRHVSQHCQEFDTTTKIFRQWVL